MAEIQTQEGKPLTKEELKQMTESPPPVVTGARPPPMFDPSKVEDPASIEEEAKPPEETITDQDYNKSLEQLKTESDTMWNIYKDKVEFRKFDSDDSIKLKSQTMIVGVSNTVHNANVDLGAMQKISIILGIRNCPWFSDVIDENEGVTPTIYGNRMTTEFRKIPPEIIDRIFKEVREHNKRTFAVKDLTKK